MPVKIEQGNGVLNVLLEGEIDHHTAKPIRERIDETAEKTRPRLMCLDFTKVSFMDSSGIGLVIGRYKLMKMLGGSVRVTGVSGAMEKIMKMAGLERLGVLGEEVKENEKTGQ